VKSLATRRFWNLLHALPVDVQKLAAKNYLLWRQDPSHPSLHFRRLQGSKDRYTVRVGDHYRALGFLTLGTVTWVWIGTHSDYDRLVDRHDGPS
jgi:hypothetical protein